MDALVRQWLDSLSGRDFERLLDLYHPEAVLDADHEVLEGREAIGARLRRYNGKFRGVRLELVGRPSAHGSAVVFTTDVTGRVGRWLIRHAWYLEEGLIRRHGVEALAPPA